MPSTNAESLAPFGDSVDRVLPSDHIKPMSEPEEATWSFAIRSQEHLKKIINGFQPRDMDDKWFIYTTDSDDGRRATTYFCRSWTGYTIYEIEMVIHDPNGQEDGQPLSGEEKSVADIVRVKWETGKERFRLGEEDLAQKEVLVLSKFVLDADLEE